MMIPLDQWVEETCPKLKENIMATLDSIEDDDEETTRIILMCVRQEFSKEDYVLEMDGEKHKATHMYGSFKVYDYKVMSGCGYIKILYFNSKSDSFVSVIVTKEDLKAI